MVVPKKEKYRKRFRGKMKGVSSRGARLAFTERQLEAARQAIVHRTKREGRVWIRVVNDHPITSKPSGAGMGKGKGDIAGHVAVIRPGKIIFELGGMPEEVAKGALKLAAAKLSIKAKIVSR